MCPGPQSAALYKNNNNNNKQTNKQKISRGVRYIFTGAETLEMKAPKEGAETVFGGRVFQSLTVLGKNKLRW